MSYRNKSSLGQPGYAAERYIPTNLGSAPYAEERYIPVSRAALGQPGYAAERYLPVSLGQPNYVAERYLPVAGMGQAKTGTTSTTSSKTGTTSGGTSKTGGTTGGGMDDGTARDVRAAADVGGSLIGGLVRGFTGGSTTPTTTDTSAMTTTTTPAPVESGGTDWYWPVIISGGLILFGGIGYFALKGSKKPSAPTANKRRKRVSRNGYGRSYSGDPRWMTARYDGTDDQGNRVRKGDEVLYWPRTKKMMTGQRAEDAWLRFLSEKGDEEGMPFARNGWSRRASKAWSRLVARVSGATKGKRRSRSKRTSRR